MPMKKIRREIASGDKFRVKQGSSLVYEVLELREMQPAPHAIVFKQNERKSPVLIAVSTLLDGDLYERI
ncbi:hypothetical protein [Thalassospira sp.]|uniref:hypothetical protein n=1 Tax=Thalassospira sp. TaxID=1912094 RepID=UPI0027347523|nr:hypothetical protein [Thalassospira sp.]MDP2700123.1 hypothetical protein [Thalassospira sp.]